MPLLCHAAHRVLRTPQPLEFNMNKITVRLTEKDWDKLEHSPISEIVAQATTSKQEGRYYEIVIKKNKLAKIYSVDIDRHGVEWFPF